MNSVDDYSTTLKDDMGPDLGLIYWPEVGDSNDVTAGLNVSRVPFERPALLKQTPILVVIYALSYSAVFLLGVTGNTLIVWIIFSTPQMRTVTNYFIVNLAIADILVLLICLPINLLTNLFSGWLYGPFLCKAVPFLQGVSVSASVNSLMAIAFDRYFAICHGMKFHLTRKWARVTIALIWTFSVLVMSPWAVFYQHRVSNYGSPQADPAESTTQLANGHQGNENSEYVCVQSWPSIEFERIYFLTAIFVTCYTIPLVCITACYLLIGRRVCNRHALGTQTPAGASGQTVIQRSKVKVIKMLVTVVIIFAVTWLPTYILRLRMYWGPEVENEGLEFTILVQIIIPIAQWFVSANSCVNPFIYCFFSNKFRSGFRNLFAGRLCCGKRPVSSSFGASYRWRRRSTTDNGNSLTTAMAAGSTPSFNHCNAIVLRHKQCAATTANANKVQGHMADLQNDSPMKGASDVVVFVSRSSRSDFVVESTVL